MRELALQVMGGRTLLSELYVRHADTIAAALYEGGLSCAVDYDLATHHAACGAFVPVFGWFACPPPPPPPPSPIVEYSRMKYEYVECVVYLYHTFKYGCV